MVPPWTRQLGGVLWCEAGEERQEGKSREASHGRLDTALRRSAVATGGDQDAGGVDAPQCVCQIYKPASRSEGTARVRSVTRAFQTGSCIAVATAATSSTNDQIGAIDRGMRHNKAKP
jgi:hypothetical protein